MNKAIKIVSAIVATATTFALTNIALADSVAFSVSDATSTTNTMYGNTNTIILYGLGTLILAAVGLGFVGFYWRHIKKIIGLKRF
jgi:hypothetical protein